MARSVQIRKSFAESLHMRCKQAENASKKSALVLLHGNSFDSGVFDDFVSLPALRNRDVIALDLPGHGSSACLPQSQKYSFTSMAERVAEALDTLDLSGVTLVGWSLGGHVALELFRQTERVKGAVICGTPIMPKNPISNLFAMHFTPAMLLASKRNLAQIDALRFEQLAIGEHSSGKFVPTILASDGRARSETAQSVLMSLNSDQRKLALEAGERLCIVNSGNDPLIRSDYISRFVDYSGFTGTSDIFADAGHAAFLDMPERFAETVLSFDASLANVKPVLSKVA